MLIGEEVDTEFDEIRPRGFGLGYELDVFGRVGVC